MQARDPIAVNVPQPSGLVSAFGSIWVQSRVGDSVWKISPRGEIEAQIEGVSESPPRASEPGTFGEGLGASLAAGDGYVWTLLHGRVLKIDPATTRVVGNIRACLPAGAESGETWPGATALTTGAGAVWVACSTLHPSLVRIDPSSDSVSERIPMGTTSGGPITVSQASVWWINASEGASVQHFDVDSDRRFELSTPLYANFVVAAGRHTWLVSSDGDAAKVEGGPRSVSKGKKISATVLGVDAGHHRIWVNSGHLVEMSPETGRVLAIVRVGSHQYAGDSVAGVAVLGHRVWLVDPDRHRIVGVKAAA